MLFRSPTGATTLSVAPPDRTIQVSDINRNDTSYIKIEGLTGRVKTSRTP